MSAIIPGMEEKKYNNDDFYHSLSGSMQSAKEILPLIFSGFKPASVLDVGCGLGDWLFIANSLGVENIFGIDGDYIDKDRLKIPLANFKTYDLKSSFNLEKKFDLVMSLEVGEHIPEDRAATFVESLTNHGDIILFSAAIPGQEGTYHINEQWPSYWADKFMAKNFTVKDIIRPVIWNNEKIEWWYRQNCFFCIKNEKLHLYNSLIEKLSALQQNSDLDKIHPALYLRSINDSTEWESSVWTLPQHLMNSIRRAFKKIR